MSEKEIYIYRPGPERGYLSIHVRMSAKWVSVACDEYLFLGPDPGAAFEHAAQRILDGLSDREARGAWILPGRIGGLYLPRRLFPAPVLDLLRLVWTGPFFWTVGPFTETTEADRAVHAAICAGQDPGPCRWLALAPEVFPELEAQCMALARAFFLPFDAELR